jgi:alanyl-tRNA synthetase
MKPGNKEFSRFSVDQLVKDFLEFFQARNHHFVPSAPLLPEDPTLLFTAAGMVPFKSYYSAPDTAPYPRVTSVQKCLRAGGKQSDLENVGRTLRHHTFFEMLGNFSFGDYFKKEAIEWGWELSVDVWNLDKDRLWVSIYLDDDEAFGLWADFIGFPRDRIIRMDKTDNFWGPVGDTGVCGPCSEMYYDTGRGGDGARPGDPGTDDRFIEYWNLVFPQYFYTEGGVYDPLPRPGIDTGLGLERIAFILQNAPDNYHTDEFTPIREAIGRVLPDDKTREKAAVAINVASDHVRALTFALAEGIVPSNEGRGYVLRRLLRRALTKMQPYGVREPFLAGAVDVVVDKMGGRYPEIIGRAALVKEMITAEEERFLSTLEQGISKLETVLEETKTGGKRLVKGADAFLLYDTFGFPLELTEELAEDRGLTVDRAGFEFEMAQQKERARKGSHFAAARNGDNPFIDLAPAEATKFTGYEDTENKARLVAYRIIEKTGEDNSAALDFITDRTVFYAESGGQVGDAGSAEIGGKRFEIFATFYAGDRVVHRSVLPADVKPATVTALLEKNREVFLSVDADRRMSTKRNHTATHLLHSALRKVLGDHVAQAGSLVAPDRLRFDFFHFQAMRDEEIAEVERLVSNAVMDDTEVTKQQMDYKDAVSRGAMALFGEKYAEQVRVVSIADVSMELCGGTHLDRTGEIGPFFVRQETAVAAGVRRIEALTGAGAMSWAQDIRRERRDIAQALRVGPEEVGNRVKSLLEETETLQKQLRKDASKRAKDEASDAISQAEDVGGVRFVSLTVDADDVGALRKYGDELRNKIGLGLALLCQNKMEKPVVLIVASDRLIEEKSMTAAGIAKKIASELSWRGGGKPHMAQVGIPHANDFRKLSDFVRETLY